MLANAGHGHAAATGTQRSTPPRGLRGDLVATPAPRVLYRLAIERFTGEVVFRHVELVVRVCFQHGDPLFISCNYLLHRLGQILVAHGDITTQQLDKVVAEQAEVGGSFPVIFLRHRLLDPNVLLDRMREQARLRMRMVFAWGHGRFEIFPGRTPPEKMVSLGLDPLALITDATRHGYKLERLTRIFAPFADHELRLQRARYDINRLALNQLELRAYQRLRDGMTVREAMSAVADARISAEAGLRALFLLIQCDLASVRPLSAQPVGSAPTFAQPTPRPTQPAQSPLAPADTSRPVAPANATANATSADPALAPLESLLSSLRDKNMFERLGVADDCSTADVNTAYVKFARQYHPDTSAGNPAEQHLKEQILALISEARDRLSTPDGRAGYKASLELGSPNGQGVDVARIMEAEGLFTRGRQLLSNQRPAKAAELFERAASLTPEAEYRAYLAYARHLERPDDAEQAADAERLFREWIDRHPEAPAEVFVFLGQIQRNASRLDEAAKTFKEALRRDSRNIEAQRELRLLAARKDAAKPAAPGFFTRKR